MSIRSPIVLAPETMNHVTQHATGDDVFCRDAIDRDAAVAIIGRSVEKYELELVDYCVMTNHIHLVTVAPRGNLARAMQHLWARLVERFNRRHDRCGHLVQAPYFAKPIEDDPHYLQTRAYVAMNPVEAGLCQRPEQWRWSGYGGRGVLTPLPDARVAAAVVARLADWRAQNALGGRT